jgi:peptidoglycan/LPS O-acetylase OafA/YrhL
MKLNNKELSHPKYRPDIDGLRAVAVLSVVEFHAFPNRLTGGLIGVDIFFVISGFLISTIILENLDRGSFSFLEFYARRVKRIFPALFVVLCATYAFGWAYLFADEYKQLGKHVAAGSFFVTNFVLWYEAGYFDVSSIKKPLLHLWSLGVEDQFYIVWPFLLWLAFRKNLNQLTVAVVVLLGSFFLNVIETKSGSVGAFYSPQTRFWELLFGGMLAWNGLFCRGKYEAIVERVDRWLAPIIYRAPEGAERGALAHVSSLLGGFLLVYGLTQIKGEAGFPGFLALIPVVGTSLVIISGPDAWLNKAILSARVLVWFGLISYPLYLWHWPIISFAHILAGKADLSNAVLISAISFAVGLAWVTYRFVEKPVRGQTARKVVIALLVLVFSVGGVGFFTYRHDGLPERNRQVNDMALAAEEWEYPGDLKPFIFGDKKILRQESQVNDITLFVGDSNVQQYYPRVDELIKHDGSHANSAVFIAGGGCLVVPLLAYDDAHKHCQGLSDTALSYARNEKRVRNIVISEQWNGYLYAGYGLVGSYRPQSKDYTEALLKLSSFVKDFRRLGKEVYVVLNIPGGPEFDPKHMLKRNLRTTENILSVGEGGAKRGDLDDRYLLIQEDIRRAVASEGAHVIAPMDFLCTKEFCPSLDEVGKPIYKDSSHLRPEYVRRSVGYIDQAILSSARRSLETR